MVLIRPRTKWRLKPSRCATIRSVGCFSIVAIEVRQMIIKSTVVSGRKEAESPGIDNADLELLKEEVVEMCKEMIERRLDELQER